MGKQEFEPWKVHLFRVVKEHCRLVAPAPERMSFRSVASDLYV